MGEMINEVELGQSFQSPPRRRRSTFFDRRESLAPQQPENVSPNICKHNTSIEERRKEKLARYMDQLLAEKEQWKEETNRRRNHCYDIVDQCNQPITSGRMRSSYSELTNEDIAFSRAKANISKLVKSQQELHKSVKVTRALFLKAIQLDGVLLEQCEAKVNKITDYIFENSTIDLID